MFGPVENIDFIGDCSLRIYHSRLREDGVHLLSFILLRWTNTKQGFEK